MIARAGFRPNMPTTIFIRSANTFISGVIRTEIEILSA